MRNSSTINSISRLSQCTERVVDADAPPGEAAPAVYRPSLAQLGHNVTVIQLGWPGQVRVWHRQVPGSWSNRSVRGLQQCCALTVLWTCGGTDVSLAVHAVDK